MPSNRDRRRTGIHLAVLIATVIAAQGLYLFWSGRFKGPGFPLDDAWIHQTYARNLAETGRWEYQTGQVSAGSTSPLWTLWIAAGHFTQPGATPFAWTIGLGGLSLLSLAWAGQRLFERLSGLRPAIPWAGVFLALEWHMVWGSVSGMETVLAAALSATVLALSPGRRWERLLAGLIAGAAVWVRPDAIMLLGPLAVIGWIGGKTLAERVKLTVESLAAALPGIVGLLLFNFNLAGTPWPNTFYAKQSEYAALMAAPLVSRWLDLISLPWIGAGALLLPGAMVSLVKGVARKNWVVLAGWAWALGYTAVYAWRLPVTYQYGRYIMPVMPILFILAWSGTCEFYRMWRAGKARNLAVVGWVAGVAALTVVFLGIGADRYARDVGIIQTEMVATARWIESHTPPTALIAAHDIGAIGYFSDRRLVDLAGLVSPELIPILREEPALAAALDARGVDYLVTFPGWYAQLGKGKAVVFQTDGVYSPQAGGENMVVYRWR